MNEEDGRRVFDLSTIAELDRDFDAAIEGYKYILEEKGRYSAFFVEAQKNMLSCKRKKLTEGFTFTKEELQQIEKEYEQFLDEIGRNKHTAPIVAELADLEAFYLKNLEKASALLEELIDFPMVDKETQSRAKLSLGDFYLIKGERWEATLLYSQVDKYYKEGDILGHEARFKNAKLSYFFGDFDWAKTQFDVLKASTSKLISNDAIDMSVFIIDNTQDSITEPLEMYAAAELLVFQNRFDEAFVKLDSIKAEFPEHSLDDDVYYLKAQIYKKQRDYPKAITAFEKILEKHKEEIRADNALFEMAEIYELRLDQKDKAKELYEKLFTEFTDSSLAVEARKRFRILRGDKVGREQ